jgi:hypothetical protein
MNLVSRCICLTYRGTRLISCFSPDVAVTRWNEGMTPTRNWYDFLRKAKASHRQI